MFFAFWIKVTLSYAKLPLSVFVISLAVHPCDKAESPCKNEATCERAEDQFVCKCAEGWKGETCEEKGRQWKVICLMHECGEYWDEDFCHECGVDTTTPC
jgi:hypothetical protein